LKKIILAVAVAAVAVMAVASAASADVGRYQVPTSLTASALNGLYVHTYALDAKCNGTFTGTGGITSLGLNETITGTLNGGNVVIDSTYKSFNVPFS
jgi:opacity protein-like surface antigen